MLCFAICLYKIYVINTYNVSILTSFPISKHIPIGIFRSLSISIIFIAISREIPGSLLIILLQLPIPLSIILSRCISSSITLKSISRPHWTAITLIHIGAIFGFASSFVGHLGSNYIDYNNDSKTVNAWWYTPIIAVCALPQSLCILYKEIKLKQLHSNNNKYPNELIHAWTSFIQCIVSFFLTPILMHIGDPKVHSLSDWYLYLHKAFLCLFGDSIDGSIFCPNGNTQTVTQFVVWLFASILVLLLSDYIKLSVSPLMTRFCILFGLLFAFICFQIAFPHFLLSQDQSDAFDECLLLGILCTFIGNVMLLIDFNPSRSSTLLDSVQFDELNHSKEIKSQLLTLKEQHQSLTMSQSQININIHQNDEDAINLSHQFESKSLSSYGVEHDNASNFVHYLLLEQQKEIIKQEYESKLKEYKRAERQRSQTFHSEFYAEDKSPKRKKKKKKKYYMDEQQIENYHRLLKEEYLKKICN